MNICRHVIQLVIDNAVPAETMTSKEGDETGNRPSSFTTDCCAANWQGSEYNKKLGQFEAYGLNEFNKYRKVIIKNIPPVTYDVSFQIQSLQGMFLYDYSAEYLSR